MKPMIKHGYNKRAAGLGRLVVKDGSKKRFILANAICDLSVGTSHECIDFDRSKSYDERYAELEYGALSTASTYNHDQRILIYAPESVIDNAWQEALKGNDVDLTQYTKDNAVKRIKKEREEAKRAEKGGDFPDTGKPTRR